MESKEVEQVNVSQLGLAVGERRAQGMFLSKRLMLLGHRSGLHSPLIFPKDTRSRDQSQTENHESVPDDVHDLALAHSPTR